VRIGIDGKCLLPPRAGVARYLEGLLSGWRALAISDPELELLQPTGPRRTLPWVLWDLQQTTNRFDLFHFPFYYPPLWPRCPVTVAIHDLLLWEHPEWFPHARWRPLRRLIARGARRADGIVTVSHAAAAAIESRLRVPRSKIHVIAHGVDHELFAPPDPAARAAARRKFGLHRPYLFQLGALEPRRGLDLAFAALAALGGRFPDLELLLAGEPRAPVPELERLPSNVRHFGRVDDGDLPALLAEAAAVLAPSRGEGFDLPVLEALACGAVVVLSDIPVHLEHFGDAAESFTSGDAAALAAALTTVLTDSDRARALRAAGVARAAAFDWKDSARRHLELWRALAPALR